MKEKLFDAASLPPSRFLGQWDRVQTGSLPALLACRVIFPWSAPGAVARDVPADTIWVPTAPEPLATEMLVFLSNLEPAEVISGPKKSSTLGTLPLEGGGHIHIFQRVVELPTLPSLHGSPKFFKGISKEQLMEANRLVMWGEQPDGSIFFLESRVEADGAAT
ncbi:MAG: hypothetical protein H3C29_15095 [Simplicispira suum]|uniref:hypothetical protein n=1 Tax=Simplicispira suum TaxID=2109915 RepID=UPI001C6CBE35|nr:hypothetical protein [Simplicispira suum]MBW7834529.1 hypothetical protein [Simplicispira suum]